MRVLTRLKCLPSPLPPCC
uniref:Uncharacterized protein n=1 Tax=Anguilla anguilla TaxID=7936 RepID=A0A0E9V6U8_ANGAN